MNFDTFDCCIGESETSVDEMGECVSITKVLVDNEEFVRTYIMK